MRSKSLAVKTNYLVLIIVAIYLLSQLIVQLTLGESWIKKNLYLILIFIQILIIFLPALLFTVKQRLSLHTFIRVRKITFAEAVLVIFMAISSSFIASVFNACVIYILGGANAVKTNSFPVPGNTTELWIQIFVTAFLPAFCEEFFFRGIIYRAFEGLGTYLAIGVSAFYFALFHFDIRNLLGPFFLGLLIAWYCYRTGSILAGILAHFTNNLLATLISWFNRDTAAEPAGFTNETMGQLFVLALSIGAILLILIKAFETVTSRKIKEEPKPEEKLPMSLIFHWPICFFYVTYIVITFLFLFR